MRDEGHPHSSLLRLRGIKQTYTGNRKGFETEMELNYSLVIRAFCHAVILTTIIATITVLPGADGFTGGAPDSAGICSSMLPGHSGDAQTSPAPYEIKLDKKSVDGGDKVIVTLLAKEDPFKGFLCLGRKKDFTKDKTVQGKFLKEVKGSPGGEDMAKATNCGDVQGSSSTHTSADEKKKVELEWEAPNEDGEYVIVCTFVKNFATFWTEHPSEAIAVKKNVNLVVRVTSTEAPAPVSDAVQHKLKGMYTNCGDTKADIPKGCFGIPDGCVKHENCELFVTFRLDGENGAQFELAGKSSSYVAVGLSHDSSMGEDSVIGCRSDGNNVAVGEYYNTKSKVSQAVIRQSGSPSIVRNAAGQSEDGYIMCNFNVNKTILIPETGEKFELENDKVHLLLSRGTNSAKDYLGQHPTVNDRAAAPTPHRLSEAVVVQGQSPLLVQLHGAFMIIAWLFLASTGMFTARYYKNTHTESKPCGTAFWFAIHRSCMFLALLLSISASVIIFVDVGDYTHNPTGAIAEHYHPILGIILTALLVLQVLIAFCRPGPTAKSRVFFNWFHWLVGNAVHIIAVACIFLANNLKKSNLQNRPEFWGLLTGFVIFHILLHIIMSIHTLKADKEMAIRNKKRAVLPGPMKAGGMDVEAPGSGFRSALLAIYALVAAGVASGLVYFVIISLEGAGVTAPEE